MFTSPELEGGVVCVTMALRKSWAKGPNYWISIVRVERGRVSFWHVVRHWIYQGARNESVSDKWFLQIGQAFDLIKNLTEEKIRSADYVLHEVKLTAVELEAPVDGFLKELQASTTPPVPILDVEFEQPVSEPEPDPDDTSFHAAMKRRKKTAKWG